MEIPCDKCHLQRPKRWNRRTSDVIATSISPSGYLITASLKEIRTYNPKEASRCDHIPYETVFAIPLKSDDKGIKGIAVSEDLLAILTHRRLLVCDHYKTRLSLVDDLVDDRAIDQKSFKTSGSVSISQDITMAMETGAIASIAVAGAGENGVKVFRYSYRNGWNTETDRMILKCPGNIGVIKSVGFSPIGRNPVYGPLIYALTANSHLYCWRVGGVPKFGLQIVNPSWHLNCNAIKNLHVGHQPLRFYHRNPERFLVIPVRNIFCNYDLFSNGQTTHTLHNRPSERFLSCR